jgi:SSS family solute:Na+ symporter
VISSIGILLSAVASCLPGMEIISSIFGVGELPAAIILMTLVAAYTFFGGMKSAAIGGILKMAVIWLSLFVCGFEAYEVLASSSVAIPPSHLDLFGRGFEVSMSNLFSMIVGVLCTQTYIQCIFSADTPITAAAGCITAALIVIPVGLPSVAVGMYMSAFDPNVVPVLTLPTYFTNHASFLVGGLAMGGIVLSLISSIGGLSLGIGTMLVTDILMPILHLQDDKALLRLTKISVLSVMAAACVIAAMNRGTQVLFWNYLSMGLRGGGIFLPLTLSVFFPGHLKRGWAVLSMAGSTVAAILAVVLHLPIDSLFAGLIVSVLLILPGLRLKRVDGE